MSPPCACFNLAVARTVSGDATVANSSFMPIGDGQVFCSSSAAGVCRGRDVLRNPLGNDASFGFRLLNAVLDVHHEEESRTRRVNLGSVNSLPRGFSLVRRESMVDNIAAAWMAF